jgi:hypothetical protein
MSETWPSLLIAVGAVLAGLAAAGVWVYVIERITKQNRRR